MGGDIATNVQNARDVSTTAVSANFPDVESTPGITTSVNVLSEVSPLLRKAQDAQAFTQTALANPRGFVIARMEGIGRHFLGPLLALLPTINEKVDTDDHVHPLGALCLEGAVLMKYAIPTCL